MDNTFYYFFSATPQVLAAILALFGVFVVFKLQSIKDELLACGRVIFNRMEYIIGSEGISDNETTTERLRKLIRNSVYKCLQGNDMDALKDIIDEINSKDGNGVIFEDVSADKDYDLNQAKFISGHIKRKEMIKDTLYNFKITAISIVSCILILSLGKIITSYCIIIYPLMIIIICLVIYIFYQLMFILKKSLT